MGLIEIRQKHVYLNVRKGVMTNSANGKDYAGVSGVITGIRVVERSFKNQRSHQLHIKIQDPESNTTFVIAGTVLAGNGDVTTWGRMLVARLVNPANKLGKGEVLEFGVWSNEDDSKVTFASLRRPGEEKALQGVDLDPKNAARCRYLTEEAIKKLITIYGEFGVAAPHAPADVEEEEEYTIQPNKQAVADAYNTLRGVPPQEKYDEAAGLGKHPDDDLPF